MKTVLFNILAIYRRELLSYFASPLAYTIAAVFWLIAGLLFTVTLDGIVQQAARYDQATAAGISTAPIDIPYQFIAALLGVIGSLSLVVLPMLSMGLYAEERKRGTLELLATSPLTNWSVAVGKLLGVLTFFFTMTLPLLIYEAIALANINPPIQISVLLLGHAGLLLLAGAVLSLGMFISSLTDSTILAAIFTFALILVLWVIELIARNLGGSLGNAIGHLSLLKHYTNLIQGILDTSSLIVFASYIVLGIFLTAQSIETFRFQRS